MKKTELLQAQLTYVREHQDIDDTIFETTLNLFLELDRLHEQLRLLVEAISGHPKGRFDMLRALFLHPEGILRPADLAMVAEMTRASTSHNLDVLERDGLIHRKTDPKDRRSARVGLTPKGRNLMSEMMPNYLKAIETMTRSTPTSWTEESVQSIKNYNAHLESLIRSFKEGKAD